MKLPALPLAAAAALMLVAACAQPANARRVTVDADLSHSALEARARQTTYLRVALTGFQLPARRARAPMNVAIVIDKSSSMSGEKIARAKDAALAALAELGPDDIVSVVAYDTTISVLVPATKVADRATIVRGIQRLRAGGSTALFAGAAKGAAEVRKFMSRDRVNRVVLLSDGQANVGPSSPGELGRLGTKLRREGISVTTVGLGLGYNEDLMVELAARSGGNHAFVEHPSQLTTLFREGFGSLASICAKEVTIKVTFAEGFRPVRVLGRDADILGQSVVVPFAQLYAGELDDVVIELETAGLSAATHEVARVEVAYLNLVSGDADTLQRNISARFIADRAAVAASTNEKVMVSVVERLADERSRLAMRLRDEGRLDEARRELEANVLYLQGNAEKYDSPVLKQWRVQNDEDLDNLAPERWERQRKKMRHRQMKVEQKGGLF